MADFIIPTVEEVIASRRDATSYSELRFPDDLGAHAIILNFSDYSFDRSANTVSTVTTSSICLPIPTDLQDNTNIRYQGYELGAIGDLSREVAGAAVGASSADQAVRQVIDSGKLNGAAVTQALKAGLASMDNSVVKGAESALGMVVNPHLALTFDTIELKTHSFEWQLAPTSPSESVRLAKIIKTIKRSILPSFENDKARVFLKYPKVVDVFFLGSEPGFLYFFKRCMVTSFETNYAGAGTPAFLPNGRPAFVRMRLSLQEMEIHTAEDYGDTSK